MENRRVASQIAIYPNLNYSDEVWRNVLRDVRVRRALSLASIATPSIRPCISNWRKPDGDVRPAGLALLQRGKRQSLGAHSTPDQWPMRCWMRPGWTSATSSGIRLLPDGRPMELVIETAGERQEVENALQIVTDTLARDRCQTGDAPSGPRYPAQPGFCRQYDGVGLVRVG